MLVCFHRGECVFLWVLPPSDQIRCHLKGVAAGLGIDEASGVVNNPGEEGPVDVQGELKLKMVS
jgi:hypothetical protein